MIRHFRTVRHLKGGLALGLAAGLTVASASYAGAQTAPGSSEIGHVAGSSLGDPTAVPSPNFETGSAALRSVGSSQTAEAGGAVQAVGSLAAALGSTALLAPLGSTSGSASGSVASSGLLPGSTYVNASGSLGLGTIGSAGLISFPEYVIGSLGLNLVAGYLTAVGERQEEGDLTEGEVVMWHNVVNGSAQASGALETVAAATGSELPGSLVGSIGAVKRSANEDPRIKLDQARAEAEAKKAEEEAGDSTTAEDKSADTKPAGEPSEKPKTSDAPAAKSGPSSTSGDANIVHTAQQAQGDTTLAQTGSSVGPLLGLSALALLLGVAAVGFARRRA